MKRTRPNICQTGVPPLFRYAPCPFVSFIFMKNILFTLISCCIFQINAFAQTTVADTTQEAVRLQETIISANRVSQARSAVAQQVTVLRRADIERVNAQTTAELIQNSGAAFVQKSQQGGGSPVLRGFEASRVLMVVDGVRMNNAIYRAGHLQNILTMDNAALDRVEVLFGPASTVYGTDALGGAICFFTKNPTLSNGGFHTTGGAFARYSTVNEEKTAHVDFSLAGRRLGAITSLTYSDFGDLRMGEQEGFAPFFGKRDFYVERINGQDQRTRNSDPYVQKFTGYTQYDVLEKIVFQANSNVRHTLNLQYSNSSDIPRYDRLTDLNAAGELSVAEWYYGPQKRLMGAYTLGMNELGWFNQGLRATLSYQDIEESRHNRNFGAATRTDRVEQVKVYGFLADAHRAWGRQNLHIGLDGQYNDVTSTAQRYNVNTGAITAQSTRYPDGDNTVSNISLYATHNWQGRNSAWTFSEGIRVGYASLHSTFKDKTFFPFPFDAIDQSSPLASGSLGAVWEGSKGMRIAINASSGFRMPNVDDLAKVFDSVKGSVIVPNPDIEPEQTYNLDLNVTKRITDRLRWENVGWVTAFQNAIITAPFTFNGQSIITYDGTPSKVLANQNTRKATIVGFSSSLEADLLTSLAGFASITFTQGRIGGDEASAPLDHIPPTYGRFGARWHTHRAWVQGSVLFNGKKDIKDYSNSGEDNAVYAPREGMPGWMTINLNGSYRFGKYLTLQAGLENLLDMQYRVFASGINGPGRNLFVTLRTQW